MQFDQFKRRFAARGQQRALPTIGFFGTTATMRTRREFITLAAGAAAAYSGSWSRNSHAQPTGKPVVGLLNGQHPTEVARYVSAFREGFKEAGL